MIPSFWRERAARVRRPAQLAGLAAAAISLGAGGALATTLIRDAYGSAGVGTEDVRRALALRLPKTRLGAIDCRSVTGLCEVVAGSTLFYVDRAARFLVIGHVYDMVTRSDVTASRLLALSPAALLPPGRAEAASASDDPSPPRAVAGDRVNLAELPRGGAISWGEPNAPRLVVLSDFACGYCRKLTAELAQVRARIEERPISIFGPASRRVAEQVLCAADPVRALHAAYRGEPLADPRACDTRGLDANEAFARHHAFGGTPVLIRADGRVLEGYRPAAAIRAFLAGGAA